MIAARKRERSARLTRRPTSWTRDRAISLSGLLGGSLLSELLSSDLTAALVALHSAESTQMSKDVVFRSLADGSEFLDLLGASDGQDSSGNLVAGGSGLELLSGGVVDQATLGLALTAREEDELRLVRVESLDVELELLLRGVGSSVIN